MLLDPNSAGLVRKLIEEGAVQPPARVLANAAEAMLGAVFLAKLPAFPHASMRQVLELRRDLDAPPGPLPTPRCCTARAPHH